jgi:hypothetical protein
MRVIYNIVTVILFFAIILWGIEVYSASTVDFSVANGQVYLSWESGYGVTYTVLRSNVKGGRFYVIKDKLQDPKYCDTPEQDETTYYYIIVKINPETGEEYSRTKEVGIYVP